jgi:UDP-glucose 4-epimerase
LAALPSVSYSIEEPYKSFKNNVDQTTLMLFTEAKQNSNIKRIVFASSAAVYGNTSHFPTHEDEKLQPESPMDCINRLASNLMKLHGKLSNIDTVSLRYFNVYGPHQLSSGPYATAVSAWLHNINNNLPLRKDGTGEQSRDMVFVEDVVQANIFGSPIPR